MRNKKIILISTILLVGISSCSLKTAPIQPTPLPTIDHAAVVAEAVNTMEARITEQAIANPSATTAPTQTQASTETRTPLPTETAEPVEVTPTATRNDDAPAVQPTMTLIPAEQTAIAKGYSAKFLYASAYGTESSNEFTPNQHFGLALGFLNTGTVAWNGGYKVALIKSAGEFTGQPEVFLEGVVKPGEKTEVNLWGFGSEQLGLHGWFYRLYAPDGTPVPGGIAVFYYTSY